MSRTTATVPKSERLQQILNDFSLKTEDALIAMVTTRDGLSVASAIKDSIAKEEDVLAVAASQVIDMTVNINNQLNQGEIGRVLIEGSDRTTIVSSAGRDILFIVVVPADAKLGLTMLSIRHVVQNISQLYN